MVQIGRRGTARRLFENSQKSQNLNFKILVHHFWHLCLLCIVKKIRLDSNKTDGGEVCPYCHSASMDATPPSSSMRSPQALRARLQLQAATRCGVPVPQRTRTTPFAARYDIGALQRGSFTNLTLFINSEWSAFGNSASGHVRNSELGTMFGSIVQLLVNWN